MSSNIATIGSFYATYYMSFYYSSSNAFTTSSLTNSGCSNINLQIQHNFPSSFIFTINSGAANNVVTSPQPMGTSSNTYYLDISNTNVNVNNLGLLFPSNITVVTISSNFSTNALTSTTYSASVNNPYLIGSKNNYVTYNPTGLSCANFYTNSSTSSLRFGKLGPASPNAFFTSSTNTIFSVPATCSGSLQYLLVTLFLTFPSYI